MAVSGARAQSLAGLAGPQIELSPAAITATVDAGQSTSRALVIQNTGDATLNYVVRIDSATGARAALFALVGNEIVQVDPVTYAVIRSFPTGSTTVGGRDAVASDGSFLYFLSSESAVGRVVDPATGVVVRPFTLPERGLNVGGALAHDGARLYVGGGINQRDVLRLSPDGQTVETRFPLPQGTLFDGDMAYGDGVLFLLTRSESSQAQVLRLDAETGAVLGSFPAPTDGRAPTGIAYVDGELHIVASPPYAFVVEPSSGTLLRSSGYLGGDRQYQALALVEGFVGWATVAPATGSVEPGGSAAATVTFDAAALVAGVHTGFVTVASTDSSEVTARIPFTLTVNGEPEIAVDPSSFALGQVYAGAVVWRDAEIRNEGTAPLMVVLESSDPAVTAVPASIEVEPGERRSLAVRVTPATVGPFSAALTVTSNDADEPSIVVAIEATVSPPPLAQLALPDSVLVTATVGSTTSAAVTVSNAGEAPLRYAVVGRPAGAAEPELYVIRSAEREVRRYNAVTGAPTGAFALPVGAVPRALAASADTIYYAGRTADPFYPNALYLIARSSGALMQGVVLPLPSAASVSSLAHDGRMLYAVVPSSSGGGLYTIHAETGAITPLSISGGSQPFMVGAVAAEPGRLFLGGYDPQFQRSEIRTVDLATRTVVATTVSSALPTTVVDGRLFVRLNGTVRAADVETFAGAVGPAIPGALAAGWGPSVGWSSPSPRTGTVAPGSQTVVEVEFSTAGLDVGDYGAALTVLTDDPLATETSRPVVFLVKAATPSATVPAGSLFSLGAPSPNPSRGSQTLALTLPAAAQVSVEVFDAMGRLVQRLADVELGPGVHSLTLPTALPAGMYAVRVRAGSNTAVQRSVIIR